ncbi:MAG TPA: hypothetical protein VFQ61_25395 [Polyangiaceae bacterium]|nr:hypothetical protein [Polyangiaceae bacterium]
MQAQRAEAVLLELREARWQFASSAQSNELSVRAVGARVALIGAWDVLFRGLAGEARLSGGSASIYGQPPEVALRQGLVGVQRFTLRAPADITPEQYLFESASLLGRGSSYARREAARAVDEYGLSSVKRYPFSALPVLEARLLALAQATLGEPRALFCELPLHRFGEAAQRIMLSALERAATGRSLLFSVAQRVYSGPQAELLSRADQRFALERGQLSEPSASPAPPNGEAWLITVSEHPDRFTTRLVTDKIGFEELGPVEAMETLLQGGRSTPVRRFRVWLEGAPARERLLHAARDTEAAILELRPET